MPMSCHQDKSIDTSLRSFQTELLLDAPSLRRQVPVERIAIVRSMRSCVAIGAQRYDFRRMIRATVRKAGDMVHLEVRRTIPTPEGCTCSTAFA
jgi:uncharacterized protein with von Willebrand factor type A (vWA) domain